MLLIVALLTALQPFLLALTGAARYEPVQLVVLGAFAFAVIRLARGSRLAWMFLVAVNALPPLMVAVMIALSQQATIGSGLIILAPTSGVILLLLLTLPMRRFVGLGGRVTAPGPAKS